MAEYREFWSRRLDALEAFLRARSARGRREPRR